ncbi:MAG: tRNA (uracil-5-)-methyltransferase [Sulfuricurvum sp. PC08-66]|nr:MAG: tRNA (uracil-5-)-methyltransferase [Sulfuricurvum sp. PC08-66]
MECNYFGVCASCTLYTMPYEEGLAHKCDTLMQDFAPYYSGEATRIASPQEHFRYRAEFRIWHEGEMHYAMTHIDKKSVVTIDACAIVSPAIAALMPTLLEAIEGMSVDAPQLKRKLFGVDFLSTLSGEMVVTLLYHKVLDSAWQESATQLASTLNIHLIGRSRKQKVVIGGDSVIEKLTIEGKEWRYMHTENSFTQPNAQVNQGMIGWVLSHLPHSKRDLLELYCGAGNFTLPLSRHFGRVVATEISKSSIKAAQTNCALNGVDTIDFVRLSSEEFVQAYQKVRAFRRLEGIELDNYDFEAIFVDPPRSGLDETTRALAAQFDTIIYISCNPKTLLDDLALLSRTHRVGHMAFFDQFAYTHHMEMGLILYAKHPKEHV